MCTCGTMSELLRDPLAEMIWGGLQGPVMVLLEKKLWPFDGIPDRRPIVYITLN